MVELKPTKNPKSFQLKELKSFFEGTNGNLWGSINFYKEGHKDLIGIWIQKNMRDERIHFANIVFKYGVFGFYVLTNIEFAT